MTEEKIEQLAKLGALYELLSKCKELVQGEGLVGGHRGNVDEDLTSAQGEVYHELENLKAELREG